MKSIFTLALIASLPAWSWAQGSRAAALSRAEEEARQRTTDYLAGTDRERDSLVYRAHYEDDAYWRGLWQQGGANSMNWYQQLRLLKIHLEAGQQRLIDSTNWLATTGELFGADLKPVVIQRRRTLLTYNYVGRIDATTEQSGSLQGLLQQLQTEWLNRTRTTDPSGNFLRRDFDLLMLSTADASAYQLAHGGSGAPDSSLFNLVVTEDEAAQIVDELSPDLDTQTVIPELDLRHPSYLAATTNMAGYLIRPNTEVRPTNILAEIGRIFSTPQTNPTRLRSQALSALFSDLAAGRFQRGNGGVEMYVFNRPATHSRAYRQALANYTAVAATLVHYYQLMIDQLHTQLQEAQQRDQEMLGLVADYRAQQNQQLPFAAVVSTSQARQLFEAQVGNMELTDIPLISIAAYALWAYVGPPWANIYCWPTTFGCIPNPLYNTITAQLVRGLETSSGMVYMGSQQAINALKNQAQQSEAIGFIQDLETKKAELQAKQDEYTQAYGNRSYRMDLSETRAPQTPLPLAAGKLTPWTEAAMRHAQQARQNSSNLLEQNQIFHEALTGEQTLLERAGLRTGQEINKTRALDELRETLSARQTLQAARRNEEAQQRQEQERLQRTRSRVPDAGP